MTEALPFPSRRLCQFVGCRRVHYAHNLCNAHYAQERKGRVLTAIQSRSNSPAEAECRISGCSRPVKFQDLCKNHYNSERYMAQRRACGVPGCPRVATRSSDGLCDPHRKQEASGMALGPIPYYGQYDRTEWAQCRYVACSQPVKESGLCRLHLQALQGTQGRPLRDRRENGSVELRDARGRAQCGTCMRWQETSQFAATLLGVRCKECNALYCKSKQYGIPVSRYLELVDMSAGVCWICGASYSYDRWTLPLGVDHDHRCCPGVRSCGKCVRGLLCGSCNLAIGQLGDDPVRLKRAAEYLLRNPFTGRPWNSEEERDVG